MGAINAMDELKKIALDVQIKIAKLQTMVADRKFGHLEKPAPKPKPAPPRRRTGPALSYGLRENRMRAFFVASGETREQMLPADRRRWPKEALELEMREQRLLEERQKK